MFLLLPIRTNNPIRRTPWVNYLLIGANMAVFLATSGLLLGQAAGAEWKSRLMLWADSPRGYEFLTSMFVHDGWMHLVGNMVFLWVFGNSLNIKLGNPVYLLFYLGSGLFAAACYVLFNSTPILGASGAVFGVAAGFLVLFPSSRVVTIYWLFFFLIGFVELSGLTIVGYFIVYNLFYLLIGADTGVAHLAHLAGALFGFTAAMCLLAARAIPRDRMDLLAMVSRWHQRASYRASVREQERQWAVHRVFQPQADPDGGSGLDPRQEQINSLRQRLAAAVAAGDVGSVSRLHALLRQLDPEQVLPGRQQLDLGNLLMSDGQYESAAQTYESLLAHYPTFESAEQVELLLGLIYRRYLSNPTRAQYYLRHCLPRLRDPRQHQMCEEELNEAGAALRQ